MAFCICKDSSVKVDVFFHKGNQILEKKEGLYKMQQNHILLQPRTLWQTTSVYFYKISQIMGRKAKLTELQSGK